MPDRAVTLMGNHEAMALAVIDGVSDPQLWLPQGGAETLAVMASTAPPDLPRAHIDWLRALPLRHDDGRRFFVHAGVDPAKPLAAQRDEDLIWIREPFLSDGRDLRPPDRPRSHADAGPQTAATLAATGSGSIPAPSTAAR